MSNPSQADTGIHDAEGWDVTPEQAMGAWVEATTQIRTLVRAEQLQAVRTDMRTIEASLRDIVSGGVPPADIDPTYAYLDAVHGSVMLPQSELPEQTVDILHELGHKVPSLPVADEVSSTMGVRALGSHELETPMLRAGASPTRRTAESIAFARAWRSAANGMTTPVLIAHDTRHAPQQALVERLSLSRDSYVHAIRGDDGAVILTDVIGNQIDPSDLGTRLGLDDADARRVMDGLEAGLEAAAEVDSPPASRRTAGMTTAPDTGPTGPDAMPLPRQQSGPSL